MAKEGPVKKEEIALQLTLKLMDKELGVKHSRIYDYDASSAGYAINPGKVAEAYNTIFQSLQSPHE